MNGRVLKWVFYAILIFLLIIGAVLIFPMQRKLSEETSELRRQQKIEEARRAESNRLSSEVAELQNSPEAVEKVAREKFNLCGDGETVLGYETPKTKPEAKPEAQ